MNENNNQNNNQNNINGTVSSFQINNNQSKIVIKANNKRIIAVIIGAIILVIMSFWACTVKKIPIIPGSSIYIDNNIFIKTILLICSLFFIITCSVYIKNYLKNKGALLILDMNGITDLSNVMSIGFIPWNDIESIYLFSDNGSVNNVSLKLIDEEKYYSKLSPLKKTLINANKNKGYPMVLIELSTAGISAEQCYEMIKKFIIDNKINIPVK